MADLAELLEHVKAATDRLDDETVGRLICCALGHDYGTVVTATGDDGSDELNVYEKAAQIYSSPVWSDYRSRAPDVSLDAALALVERVLPEQPIIMGDRQGPATKPWSRIGPAWRDADATGATLALAVLTALLSVLIDQAAQTAVGSASLPGETN